MSSSPHCRKLGRLLDAVTVPALFAVGSVILSGGTLSCQFRRIGKPLAKLAERRAAAQSQRPYGSDGGSGAHWFHWFVAHGESFSRVNIAAGVACDRPDVEFSLADRFCQPCLVQLHMAATCRPHPDNSAHSNGTRALWKRLREPPGIAYRARRCECFAVTKPCS